MDELVIGYKPVIISSYSRKDTDEYLQLLIERYHRWNELALIIGE